ncbi:RNA helicase SecA [Sphingobium sp. AN558]|uniref:preprotein translocase subunit SecA n=1 Tax=Sphingobium sp. AN558 TaxID=3133442 RepID=UPI0030BDB2B0
MPDLIALKSRGRALWREVRDDRRPVIAPYPERGPAKGWQWDRPVDLILGKAMTTLPWSARLLMARAERIAEESAALRDLDDAALDARCADVRQALRREGLREPLVDECFALIREVSGRELGMWHFPVQLMGGLVMLRGGIAEMATGEGKTITALLPAIAASLAGMPVHVFTVNDYLAERDSAKLRPVYARFGLDVGLIVHEVELHERAAIYRADVVYGTNKEITFDYLRDQRALGGVRGATRRKVAELAGRRSEPLTLRGLYFAVIDEADSIFIDEARTPLILSAEMPADDDGLFISALELAARLVAGDHYTIRAAARAVELNERGREEVAALAQGLPHTPWRMRQAREQLASQALAALHLFLRDREYVVIDDKVQIVDESTGRVMADRSWEAGLHQLIEAKERVALTGTRNTIARITYQRFFRRYLRLAGMSGTIREVADELWADYGVRVDAVPRNRPNQRIDRGHEMHRDAAAKWLAVAQAVASVQRGENGRPVLIGTRSVGDSEAVSAALAQAGIDHRVLNARQDAQEADIIAGAGHVGAVTVATNMAGRGTDIELSDAAKKAGGLHVILTAFHETSRIDRQLYGRAGRQGDPGTTQAITAIDDELYAGYAPFWRKILQSSVNSWPIAGGPADWLRRAAQRSAERHHAVTRRQTELSEDRLRKAMAFTGRD